MPTKYKEIIKIISDHKNDGEKAFSEIVDIMDNFLNSLGKDEFIDIVNNIGIIPESIPHDSTEEKLYSKVSDVVLSHVFRRLGLKSRTLAERKDSADIVAESNSGYNYSLVADAKCFRLSRTAKNQKDFKISNLSDWRGSENDYAILVAPHFQYPKNKSQIYSKALDNNVCLLSWEQISIILNYDVIENESFTLEPIWNISNTIARDKTLAYANRENNFFDKIDKAIIKKIGVTEEHYKKYLYSSLPSIYIQRCDDEKVALNNEIEAIRNYSKEQAVEELIASKKIRERIKTISKYKNKLKKIVGDVKNE